MDNLTHQMRSPSIHGRESDIVNGSEILFARGMDMGENTGRMTALGEDVSFRYMIALLIDSFFFVLSEPSRTKPSTSNS